ncbi:Crotonobetainyl-CoA reductase [Streptomyces griseus]
MSTARTALETEEHQDLRAAVAALGKRYGRDYMTTVIREGNHTDELWAEAAKLGYLGVNLPEEYGGGGGGMAELSIVLEELGAAGSPLLMMIVSPAICGTVIARFGTEEQKQTWLPGLADGSLTMAFGITEPDAGSNSHRITTTARRDGDDWLLTGRKVFVSGVDIADATLIVGRTEDARSGKLKPCLFIVPRDAPGFGRNQIDMELHAPEKQFELVLDDVRLPADALVGDEDAGLLQLFAGLNPERIMTAAFGIGMGRFALGKAVEYARTRQVWKAPIGSHQAIAHPLATAHIDLELSRLMMQKAARLYDEGDDIGAGEAANMAKYAAGEACVKAVDQAVHTLGGNGLTREYGLASLITASRVARIAPVSREMILNYVYPLALRDHPRCADHLVRVRHRHDPYDPDRVPEPGTDPGRQSVVFFLLTFVIVAIATTLVAVVQASLVRNAPAPSGGEWLRATLGISLYVAMVGLLSLAVGALIRHSAGSITVMIGVWLLLPLVLALFMFTDSLSGVREFLLNYSIPSQLGAFYGATVSDSGPSGWDPLWIMTGITAVALGGAFLSLNNSRDV